MAIPRATDRRTEIRGYTDNRILTPSAPTGSTNRRVSVIVKYQDK